MVENNYIKVILFETNQFNYEQILKFNYTLWRLKREYKYKLIYIIKFYNDINLHFHLFICTPSLDLIRVKAI